MPDASAHDQFALDGAWNFRDLGGLGTTDGARIAPGVLFRASELSGLTEAGRRTLEDFGVRTVFDFRGEAEVARSGADRVPAAVRSISVPFGSSRDGHAPHEGPGADERAQVDYMLRSYASYPALAGARHAIKGVAEAIAEGRGGVLVHCAAGKDRAGWTVATVLRAVGVAEDDIVADYLKSNEAVTPLLAHVRRTWVGEDSSAVLPSEAMLGVRRSYFEHGLSAMQATYGSFERYLTHVGIDFDLRERMTAALLVS